MAKKIDPAKTPLTGDEGAIIFQNGRAVRSTVQDIANKGPAAAAAPVTSVAGKTGDVSLSKADVGLNNVNNTADANKPISSATQAALDQKAAKTELPTVPVQSVNSKTGAVVLTKADIGLGNVSNTADADKPVSTAQAAAIAAGKLRVARFTGTTISTGVATITFSPAFENVPDIDVIEGWANDQMITGAVVAGSASKTGCQVQVMVSKGTLLLTAGPFQKAGAGVSVTVRAIGN